jgi:hypothetical protein
MGVISPHRVVGMTRVMRVSFVYRLAMVLLMAAVLLCTVWAGSSFAGHAIHNAVKVSAGQPMDEVVGALPFL